MKTRPWREVAENPAEVRAARLLKATAQVSVPAPPSLSLLQRAIAERAMARSRVRLWAAVGVLATGAAAAAWGFALRHPKEVSSPVAPQHPLKEVRETVPPPPDSPAAIPLEAPRPRPPAAPLRHAGARPPAVTSPIASPTVSVEQPDAGAEVEARSTLGEEARLLSAALSALRQDRDPERALARLAEYRDRFPAGVLRPEALLAEAEAETSRHHPEAALAVLEAMTPGEAGPLSREFDVVRGELRAALGDCRRAEAAFTSALSEGAGGVLAERAEFGLARCAVRQESPEAGGLLRQYLERWPRGHFIAEAQGLLDGLP